MAKPNKYLAHYVRTLRQMQADGWNVDLIVELALGSSAADRLARQDPAELAIARELYAEALPGKLLSEVRQPEFCS